ncbi:hypothetical protein [Endozoicomonas sp.]|uniref:hypothetical protein n=1 Tax=Endozoicomonas sp. TaxID=1892382 RepID=UPI00288457E0|nr:hypothetical protein [Endozoicomonas sp.]
MSCPISTPNSNYYFHGLYSKPANHKQDNEITEAHASAAPGEQTDREALSGETKGISARKCEVIDEPETFIARAKRLLSKIPAILCVPLRIGTTLLNVGIFAGYYVTVMTITGVGALTGALTGLAANIKARIASSPAEKSLKDYTITYAHETFEWLTFPYEKLPEKFKGSIFPAISGAVLFLFETAAIPGKRLPMEAYEKVCSETYTATRPYEPVTAMTVRLFEVTKSFIQG